MSTKPGKTITMAIVGIIALVPIKKGKALALALLSIMCIIAALTTTYPATALFFVGAALFFSGIWYCKRLRDRAIIRRAVAQWQPRPANQPTPHITQTVSGKRSNNGLFVPPPLP